MLLKGRVAIAFLVSERAGRVTGRIFGKGAPGRDRYAFVVYSHPREIAELVSARPWTPGSIAERFEEAFGARLQSRDRVSLPPE